MKTESGSRSRHQRGSQEYNQLASENLHYTVAEQKVWGKKKDWNQRVRNTLEEY
jgi:hypothetical protein